MSTFATALEEALDRDAPPATDEGREFQRQTELLERLIATAAAPLAPEVPTMPWAQALGVDLPCDAADIRRAFRRLAFRTHPDRPGGSHQSFLQAQALLDEALAWLRQAAPKRVAARFRAPVQVSTRGSVYA